MDHTIEVCSQSCSLAQLEIFYWRHSDGSTNRSWFIVLLRLILQFLETNVYFLKSFLFCFCCILTWWRTSCSHLFVVGTCSICNRCLHRESLSCEKDSLKHKNFVWYNYTNVSWLTKKKGYKASEYLLSIAKCTKNISVIQKFYLLKISINSNVRSCIQMRLWYSTILSCE